jgi:hypothetical protein
LFDAYGQIRSDVTFAELAKFVWLAETQTGYTGQADSPLLGVHEGRAIYLLYNGILKDKSVAGGNVAHRPGAGRAAALCRPQGDLRRRQPPGQSHGAKGITFKQTPYALEV